MIETYYIFLLASQNGLMGSIITGITTGIFSSAIVAVFFYFWEKARSKNKTYSHLFKNSISFYNNCFDLKRNLSTKLDGPRLNHITHGATFKNILSDKVKRKMFLNEADKIYNSLNVLCDRIGLDGFELIEALPTYTWVFPKRKRKEKRNKDIVEIVKIQSTAENILKCLERIRSRLNDPIIEETSLIDKTTHFYEHSFDWDIKLLWKETERFRDEVLDALNRRNKKRKLNYEDCFAHSSDAVQSFHRNPVEFQNDVAKLAYSMWERNKDSKSETNWIEAENQIKKSWSDMAIKLCEKEKQEMGLP